MAETSTVSTMVRASAKWQAERCAPLPSSRCSSCGSSCEQMSWAFQQRVWRALQDIPHGQTISYGELARRIGNPAAVRAVGLANGRNPVSIVVPCHRVVGADGSLTGFAGGLDRKRFLLDLETSGTLF